MNKKLVVLALLLLTCGACVSRTTFKEPGLKNEPGKQLSTTELVWFWEKDF
jgi:hypothetical protein